MSVRRFSLIPLGVAAALLLLELVLRIVIPASLIKRSLPDPVVGYRFLPNQRVLMYSFREFAVTYVTNAHGDPDVERSIERPPGVYRVAVIGDSMTEGAQVEPAQRFSALLEAQLSADLAGHASGRRVEVLNFGRAGFSTTQELALYRTHVRRFHPDLVLLVFMPVNDVRENTFELQSTRPGFVEDRPFLTLTQSGQLVQRDTDFYANAVGSTARSFRGGGIRGAVRWLRDRSALVDALTLSYQGLRNRFSTALAAVDVDVFVPSVQRRAVWRDGWVLTREIVRVFVQEAVAGGARFHVAIVSGPMEVNEETRRFVLARVRPSLPLDVDPAYDWDLPYRLTEAMLSGLALPFTNLWPAIRAAAQGGDRTNFVYDGHLTPAGHAIVARKLFPVLRRYVVAGETHSARDEIGASAADLPTGSRAATQELLPVLQQYTFRIPIAGNNAQPGASR